MLLDQDIQIVVDNSLLKADESAYLLRLGDKDSRKAFGYRSPDWKSYEIQDLWPLLTPDLGRRRCSETCREPPPAHPPTLHRRTARRSRRAARISSATLRPYTSVTSVISARATCWLRVLLAQNRYSRDNSKRSSEVLCKISAPPSVTSILFPKIAVTPPNMATDGSSEITIPGANW